MKLSSTNKKGYWSKLEKEGMSSKDVPARKRMRPVDREQKLSVGEDQG